MLQITLGECQLASPEDGMDRDWYGYRHDKSAQELFAANRGRWKLGPRAAKEGHVVFTHGGTVVSIAEIFGLEDAKGPGKRKVVIGRALEPDEPLARRWLGAPARGGFRNPIFYFVDEQAPPQTCACGCGGPVSPGPRRFLPGHDQRAVHERIERCWGGSTLEFIDWVDANTNLLQRHRDQRLSRATN